MGRLILFFALFSALAVPPSGRAATPVYRCEANGSVTFQRDPCPSGEARQRPTVEQLNAERKKRAAGKAAAASNRGILPAPAGAGPSARPEAHPTPQPRFRCDGRTRCTQMTSCAEARFFLANCPGTKMDGNGDGVPCESQWCGH